MKNVTKLTAFFLLFALAISSCKKDLQDLIENDLMFNMDANAFLQNQVQLHFVNANGTESTVPSPKISISGKDANLVFDINGGKDIQLEGQFARMVVSPGTPLSAENPAVFKVKAEAPGYLPYERELNISQLDSFMTYTLEMVELNNAPEGFRYASFEGGVGVNGAKVGQIDNQFFSAMVDLPANASYRDAIGSQHKINKAELLQFDANKDAIAAQIPYLISNYTDQISVNGIIEDFSFFPLGYTQLRVNDSDKEVLFDQPVKVSMALPQGARDKMSGDLLKAGDPMQVYQWDEQAANWKFIADANLTQINGNLVVEADVISSATVAVLSNPTLERITGRTCRSNLGIQFKRTSNVNTKHFVMLVDASDESKVFAYGADVIVANNTTYNFNRRLPTNKNFRVLVYEFETFSGKGREIARSASFSACTYTTSRRLQINVNPPTVTGNPVVRFELDTYCQNSRLFYYHEGRIEYRVSGSTGQWYDLGLAKRSGSRVTEILRVRPGTTPPPNLPPSATPSYSFLETDRLVNGTTYEFKVTISGRGLNSRRTTTRTFTKTRIFDLTEFNNPTNSKPYYMFKRAYWLANADDEANPCAIWGY